MLQQQQAQEEKRFYPFYESMIMLVFVSKIKVQNKSTKSPQKFLKSNLLASQKMLLFWHSSLDSRTN